MTNTGQAPASTEPKPTNAARAQRRSVPRDLALIAVFAALIAACALLPAINIGAGLVPITLQTFGVLLAGAVLGARRGFLAVLLYLAVGAVGLPVFAGGTAGLAPFAGPTVGYLIGMPLAAALAGFIVQRLPRKKSAPNLPLTFVAALASSIVCIHPLGIFGLMWRADLSFTQAFLTDLAFIPGDIVKNILVAIVATTVHRAFPDLLPARR